MAWDFRLIGPLEVRRDGVLLPGGTPKQRAVLALLLLRAGEPVPVDQVVAEVWGSDAPASAVNNVQVQVSALRRLLGAADVLQSRRGSYLLDVPSDSVDVHRFERSVRAGREQLDRGQAERAATTLQEGLSLWRSAPLGELSGPPFVDDLRARLQEQRFAATLDRLEADLVLGRHLVVLGELAALVRRFPLHGRLRAQQMLALYRSGQQVDALRVFGEGRDVLAAELGIDPDPELRLLHEQVLRQDPALDLAPPPPTVVPQRTAEQAAVPVQPVDRTGPAVPVPVPVSAAPLVGRRVEREQVLGLLADGARLVTLLGPGGVGKTRLAGAVLAALPPAGRPAVWVSLSELTHPEDVLPQVAMALRVRLEPGADAVADVAAALDRPCVVVLDNFEQVCEAATGLASLLQQAPGLQVLVTSQVRLNVYAEHVVQVHPLALPRPEDGADLQLRSEAVQLFYLRAAALAGRPLPPEAARDVGEICRRLDGLPLAVELAAARCRRHPPGHILAQLDSTLTELGPAPRDAPRRQQSIQAALDWSCALLSDEERQALVHLSVFSGGFPLAAAAAVLDVPPGRALSVLDQLVDKSLLVGDVDELRFGMLSVVRDYLQEQLRADDAHDAVLTRFCEWCRSFAAEMMLLQESWRGTGSAPGLLERVERELGSVTQALEWSAAHDVHRHVSLLGAALPLCFLAGRLDQVERFSAPQLPADVPAGDRHRLHRALAGLVLTHQARPALAEEHARRSLAALGDETSEQAVWARYNVAATLRCQGRFEQAVALLEGARDLRSRLALDGAGVLDGELAELHDELGRPVVARRLADAYLASSLAAQSSDDVAYAWAQQSLLLLDDDLVASEQAAVRSAAVLDEGELSVPTRVDVLQVLAMVHLAAGRPEQAHSVLLTARALIVEAQYHLLLPDHAALWGVRAAGRGDDEAAARLAGAVEAVRQGHGLVALYRRLRLLEDSAVAGVRRRLGPPRFDDCHREGVAVSRGSLAGLAALVQRAT